MPPHGSSSRQHIGGSVLRSSSKIIGISIFALTLFFIGHFLNFSTISQKYHSNAVIEEVQMSRLRSRAAQLLENLNEDKNKLRAVLQSKQSIESSASSGVELHEESIENNRKSAFDSAEQPKKAQQLHEVEATKPKIDKISSVRSYGLGFSDHHILTLSDEEFYSTSFDKMMASYGESDGGGSCNSDFGNELVNRWRQTKTEYCSKSGSKSKSSITCYLVKQTRHHGNGDNLCVLEDVSVNMGIFADDSVMRPVVKHYVDTRHIDQPYVKFPKGFVQASCEHKPQHWIDSVMPGWNAQWTTQSTSFVENAALQCDEHVDHPVLIVQRDTFANFFHDSEDFVNVFLAMAILKWNIGNTQIYLTDLYPQGPFWDMWSRVYSSPRLPALTSWDLRNNFGLKSKKGKNHRVCFKQLAIGIYGPAAPITVASWNTPCSRTALVRAYSDYVIRGLNLQHFTHYAQSNPSNKVVVTYMARRASSEWPEKRFCDSEHSFFLCDLWAHFGIRSLGRMVSNDKEVVNTLKTLESMTFGNGAKVVFQDVDYNLLTFEEQIKTDLATDIMVGPHGAGLLHNIFMRDRAVLVELSVDGSGGLRHFHNLAHWFGRVYKNLSPSNPIEAQQLKTDLIGYIEDIKLDRY